MINQKKKLVEVKHLKQYFNQGKRTKLEQLKIFRLIFIKVKL